MWMVGNLAPVARFLSGDQYAAALLEGYHIHFSQASMLGKVASQTLCRLWSKFGLSRVSQGWPLRGLLDTHAIALDGGDRIMLSSKP
jgi:hypothetical protein